MEIFGASGHCKVILDAAIRSNTDEIRIWDDNEEIEYFGGYKISGKFSDLLKVNANNIVFAIGDNKIRKKLASQIAVGFGIVRHPTAVVAVTASINDGTVIMANVVVNSDSRIGKHVILNTNCTIDHDCYIDDYVHISPKAGLAGNVVVGEGTHIGIGAVIIQGIKIGKWAIVGAGSVIIRDVPDYAVVVGNPGRIIKYKLNEKF